MIHGMGLINDYRKYGPPLLREQPFFVISFAVFLALVGYVKLEWRQRSSIEYHLDEVPSFIKLAVMRFNSSWQRLLYVFLVSYLLLFVENLALVPHTWVGYSMFIGIFHTIRRGPHSFWEFLDFRLAYHLVWFGASLLFLFLSVEIIVESLFGRCFHLCRGLRAPNAILLAGLQSRKIAVRGQALLELRHLTTHESIWRTSLFRDFIGEDASSRLLCQYFVNHITEFSSHLRLLNEDLKKFSQEFVEMCDESRPVRATAKDEIFSPRKMNILEQILDKGEKLSRPSTPPKEDNKSKLLPDILEVKPRIIPTENQLPSSSTPLRTLEYHNGYVRLILVLFGRFAKFFPGRVYAGFACEIVKSWWLGDVEMMIWTVDALSAFVVASYDEDCHGQVQFVMNDILYSLSELLQVLSRFEQLPVINGRRMLDDLFGATKPSPTENQVRRVSARTMSALESILDKFADSMDQLRITTQTKEIIRELGLVL